MKREEIESQQLPQPFIDMPLTYGDLTDHVSGGSVVNNGHCTWDSNVGAYKFTQQGRSGLSNVPYVTGLNKPATAMASNSNLNYTEVFDIYPMTSTYGYMRLMSQRADFPTLSLNFALSISNTSYVNYVVPNQWHSVKRLFHGTTFDTYIDGIMTQQNAASGAPNVVVSQSYLILSCGILNNNDYNNVSFCLRNIKYFEGQVI